MRDNFCTQSVFSTCLLLSQLMSYCGSNNAPNFGGFSDSAANNPAIEAENTSRASSKSSGQSADARATKEVPEANEPGNEKEVSQTECKKPLPQEPALTINLGLADRHSLDDYNALFLRNAAENRQTYNDAALYDVKLVAATATPGQAYWKIIGIHHLLPEENRGNHHIYTEALDENGVKIRSSGFYMKKENGGTASLVIMDKPATEAGGNIPLYKNDNVTASMVGTDTANPPPSDAASNINGKHADEISPNDPSGNNTLYHHSYYIVFQRQLMPTPAPDCVP